MVFADHNFTTRQFAAAAGENGPHSYTCSGDDSHDSASCDQAGAEMGAEAVKEAVKLVPVQSIFGLRAAGRLMLEIVAPWVQDLGLLIESIDAGPPPGAEPDWQPGAVLRLPFSR